MKKLISILFAIIIIFVSIFAVYKLIISIKKQNVNNLSQFEYKSLNNSSLTFKNKYIIQGMFWDKNELYVYIDQFQVKSNQEDLIQNQKYYLFLNLSNHDKCYFGDFIYKNFSNNFFIFFKIRSFKVDKFVRYANLLNENILLITYNESRFYAEKNKQTCQYWVKIKS